MEAVFEELIPPLTEEQALVEADRCLECGGPYAEAPCVVGCPADVDVPAFVAAIARGEYDEAARTIFGENILGGTCARVCPVEELCASVCVLEHEGRAPIEIGRLQRFAAERALSLDLPLRRRTLPYNWFRVAVIGAGPAGLAAAGELAARGYTVTVYDERVEPGGLVRFGIAPYRQQREPLPKEARLIAELGVSFELGISIDSHQALAFIEEEADAIVLAVGAGPDSETSYPGDDLEGVWNSLPFIEAIKTGHPPEVGPSVAVIGGGNTAIDVAREAVRLGAADVVVLYRRTVDEMPAYALELQEAREEGVRFEWLTVPVRFTGYGRLNGVECLRARLAEPDASGRRRPVEVPGSEFIVPVDTAVKAIGQQPRAEFLRWIEGLELDGGALRVDPATGQTGNTKYFAAGDAINGGATVVEAVRGAKIAAAGIDAWLAGEGCKR
jgi:dihydropyrimidine dehydrogenase (NAD+) subunit PreT